MSITPDGRSVACLGCGYAPLTEEPLTIGQLTAALSVTPKNLPVMVDPGGAAGEIAVGAADDRATLIWYSERSFNIFHLMQPAGEWARALNAHPDSLPVFTHDGFGVGDVCEGQAEVTLLLTESEGRDPVCARCGIYGPAGPKHLTLGELISALEPVPPDVPLVADLGGPPAELVGYKQRPGHLRLDVAWWLSEDSTSAGRVLEHLSSSVGNAVEHHGNDHVVAEESSLLWCEGRLITGVLWSEKKAILETSDTFWVEL